LQESVIAARLCLRAFIRSEIAMGRPWIRSGSGGGSSSAGDMLGLLSIG
jgi:hypothetical protein